MFKGDHVLPVPFGLKHGREVLGAGTEHTAVSMERLAMNQERDITELTLLQQPEYRKMEWDVCVCV